MKGKIVVGMMPYETIKNKLFLFVRANRDYNEDFDGFFRISQNEKAIKNYDKDLYNLIGKRASGELIITSGEPDLSTITLGFGDVEEGTLKLL